MTHAQSLLLIFARDWQSLNDGTIECGLQTGLSGAVLTTVRTSCERRGWIDVESGEITDLGRAAVAAIEQSMNDLTSGHDAEHDLRGVRGEDVE